MKLFYDMHIHSCLSPCGDDDMTPADIAGMGALNGLQIMALTDHNSCENCPAFFEACRFYGITPIAGMELTTAEDIHIVCLFPELEAALSFSDYVYNRIMPVMNKPDIFGKQTVVDCDGNEIKQIEKLLITATDITVDEVSELVKSYGGFCYPAHIDRESNGIIAVLGDIPPEPGFSFAELHDISELSQYKNDYPILDSFGFISSSDAHNLLDINTNKNYIELPDEFSGDITAGIFDYFSMKIK